MVACNKRRRHGAARTRKVILSKVRGWCGLAEPPGMFDRRPNEVLEHGPGIRGALIGQTKARREMFVHEG